MGDGGGEQNAGWLRRADEKTQAWVDLEITQSKKKKPKTHNIRIMHHENLI